MAECLNGKLIPWNQYEKYLKFHKQTIKSFVGLFNHKTLSQNLIESSLPNAFIQLHQYVTNILETNQIKVPGKEKNDEKIQLIAQTVMKI